MSRVSHEELRRLASDLSARRLELVQAVANVRLATGGQLRRRFYAHVGSSAPRLARLDLAALADANILYRLERRIGGVRAGSTGFVYALGPVGRRLLDMADGDGIATGRSRYEPSLGFVEHALAVTEIWVSLYEHLHGGWTGEHDVRTEFRVERSAWRTYVDQYAARTTLKPDAEVHLLRELFEDRWWLEVDRATERRSVIRRKLDAYVAYHRTGQEQATTGMFPITAWLTTTEARAEVLREEIERLAPSEQRLFRVGLLSAASPFLLSQGRPQR